MKFSNIGVVLALLAASPCWAIDLTACGQAVSTQGATYNLTGNLTQTGATPCFTVTAANPANIIIDCNGYSITFNGVAIDLGDRDNIEIRNCTLSTAATGYSSSAYTWIAIKATNNSASNILMHDNVINLIHNAVPEPYGFFQSNATSNNVQFYDNTCNIGGAYRSTCTETTGSGAKTNWVMTANTINVTGTSNGRPTGFGFIGSTSAEVSYNTIQINTAGTVGTTDEFQAISCYACVSPNLHHNTITDYGSHSRVFSNDNVNGGSIHHNTVYQFGTGSGGISQGIQQRGDTINMEVYQNVIDARGCAAGAGGGCVLFGIGSNTNVGDTTFPGGNRIHDNWFYVSGSATSHVGFQASEAWAADNRFWNNTISCAGDTRCLYEKPLSTVQFDGEWAYNDFIHTSTLNVVTSYATSNVYDLDFCENKVNGAAMTTAHVSSNDASWPVGEPAFTSSPCLCATAGLGCGLPVGARAEGAHVTVDASATVMGSITIQ